MLEPGDVGRTRWVDLGDGRRAEVETLASSPPVFRVAGILNSSEADDIINAVHGGMHNSYTEGEAPTDVRVGDAAFEQFFHDFDRDRDGALSPTELGKLAAALFSAPNHNHSEFLAHFRLFSPLVPRGALSRIDYARYFSRSLQEEPHRGWRYSSQAWLPYASSGAARVLLRRALAVAGLLGSRLEEPAEDLLVLRYPTRGHYSCHHDTSNFFVMGKQVRLGTLAVFLNTPQGPRAGPPGGGELAFPAADRPGSSRWSDRDGSHFMMGCSRTAACTRRGGVVVRPKRGDAVFWYNLNVTQWSDEAVRGRLGTDVLFWNSIHCGAEVTKGEKWMANLWLSAWPR